MKSLCEQFGGIYQKESEYAIRNLKMPDIENFEISIYNQLLSGNLKKYLVAKTVANHFLAV